MIDQYQITLPSFKRGFHLITGLVLKDIKLPEQGLFHLFIKHTSAALAINENADPDVRLDFETVFNKLVPQGMPWYQHNEEGDDDMPAHIKSALLGSSITIPITNGRLNLGTWQGIYLCEFRDNGGKRSLVATVFS